MIIKETRFSHFQVPHIRTFFFTFIPKVVLCFLWTFFPYVSEAQSFYSDEGRASFTSSVPLYEFTGTSTYLTGKIDSDNLTVDFYLDLETLDSGIKKRDKDMRLTLNTAQYPFAEFYGTLTDSIDINSADVQKVTAKGIFSIHGQKREITVNGELIPMQDNYRLKSEFEITLDDYGITPPSLLIVKVDPIQKIAIDILLYKE